MKFIQLFLFLCYNFQSINAQSPQEVPLPSRFSGMEQSITVNHFPAVIHPSRGEENDDFVWYWKHNTAVMASENIQLKEAGAFLLINGEWRQRVQYNPKEFSRLFSCPKARLRKSQPYTFNNNWRTDNELSSGWAAWYFIGIRQNGEKVFGWGPVYTSDKI